MRLSSSFCVLSGIILCDMMGSFFQLVESCVTRICHLFPWHLLQEVATPTFYWVNWSCSNLYPININKNVICTCKFSIKPLLWLKKVLSDLHTQQEVESDTKVMFIATGNVKIIVFWDMTSCTLVLNIKLMCFFF